MNNAQTPRQQASLAILRAAGVLPVVTAKSVNEAVQIAEALARGGLTAIELTLRTPVAMEAISALKKAVPQLSLGAGTVTSLAQAHEAADRGADFLVTPGTPVALAEGLAKMTLPVVPGSATPSEIIMLMSLGFQAVKLFPAVSVGGIAMIKSLAGPFPDLHICPTGGIGENDAATYLALPNVPCIGGSWMVANEWIKAGDFAAVETSARRVRTMLDGLKR